MSHQNEYPDNMVAMLELIWGKGYMAPGGPGNVAKLLADIDTQGKRILDIGCGIGGPSFEMARNFGATTVGIDLEAALITRAKHDATKAGLSDRCNFEVVSPGPLPFADQSFDIVISSGAFTQTADKSAILNECVRVLRPGGFVSCYEWQKPDGESSADVSDDMRYWLELEGLTYAFETRATFEAVFRSSGLAEVSSVDATHWYRGEARREYVQLSGDLNSTLVGLLGQEDADHFLEDWRAMVVVIENGEMCQGYCRGRRPTA